MPADTKMRLEIIHDPAMKPAALFVLLAMIICIQVSMLARPVSLKDT